MAKEVHGWFEVSFCQGSLLGKPKTLFLRQNAVPQIMYMPLLPAKRTHNLNPSWPHPKGGKMKCLKCVPLKKVPLHTFNSTRRKKVLGPKLFCVCPFLPSFLHQPPPPTTTTPPNIGSIHSSRHMHHEDWNQTFGVHGGPRIAAGLPVFCPQKSNQRPSLKP